MGREETLNHAHTEGEKAKEGKFQPHHLLAIVIYVPFSTSSLELATI